MTYIKMMYTQKLANRLMELEINLSRKLGVDIEFYGGKDDILCVRIEWNSDHIEHHSLEYCEDLAEVARWICSFEDPREQETDWRDYCNY